MCTPNLKPLLEEISLKVKDGPEKNTLCFNSGQIPKSLIASASSSVKCR